MDQSSCFRQFDSIFIFFMSVILVSGGCHTPGGSFFSFKKFNAASQDPLERHEGGSGKKKNTILPRQGTPFSTDAPSGDEPYRPEVIDLSSDCSPQSDDSEELLALIGELNDDETLSREEKRKMLEDIRSVDPQHQEYLIAISRMGLSGDKDKDKNQVDDSRKKKSLEFVASSPQETTSDTFSPKPAGTLVKYAVQQVGYEDARPIDQTEKREMAEDSSVSLVTLNLPPDIMRPEEIRSQPTVSLGNLDRITLTRKTDTDSFQSGTTSISRITPVEQNSSARSGQFPPNFQGQYDFTSSLSVVQSQNNPSQNDPPRDVSRNPVVRLTTNQAETGIETQTDNTTVPHIAAQSRAASVSVIPTSTYVRPQPYANVQDTQDNWEATVEQATMSLYRKLAQTPDHQASHRDEINLRLLHLALGNRREATRPVTGVAPELQQFWHDEMLGLSTLMDPHLIPDANQRSSVAHQHLVKARSHLQAACPIRIATLQFINSCEGFGVYEPAVGKFEAGGRTALYAELEDFTCQKVAEREFLTKVSSSYEFLDGNGMIIAEGSFGTHERITQCEVRDVFIVLEIGIPQNFAAGRYYFNLFVNDLNNPAQKFGQQRIEFTVVGR